jgi:hypothetical protein
LIPIIPSVVDGKFEPACSRGIDEQLVTFMHSEASFITRYFGFTTTNDQL